MNNNQEIQREDEISLLDLFTVLLRYRKLIVGITLFSVVLAVAGYFIYPAYQYKEEANDILAQGKIVISIRQNARGILSQNPGELVKQVNVIIDSLKDAGVKDFEFARKQTVSLTDETQKSRASYLINLIMIENKSLSGKQRKEEARIFWITNRDSSTVEVFFKDRDHEIIKSFLTALFVKADMLASESIRNNAESFVQNHEQLLEMSRNYSLTTQISAADTEKYAFFKDFIDGKQSVLTEVGELIITEPELFMSVFRSSYLPNGIIVVFAGFFMAVLLAFGLNIIRNIKNDETAMAKIRDAWGKTNT